jgi:hypothetical protein
MASNRRWRCQFRCRGSRRESAVAQLFSLGGMSATRSILPILTLRRGVLLGVLVCSLIHFILFSGYVDFIWRHFNSEEAVGVGFILELVLVFCILYRTPLLSRMVGRWLGVRRIVGIGVFALIFAFGFMLFAATLYRVVHAIIPPPCC